MLYELEKSQYEYNYQLDGDGHIILLFFAYPESLVLLKHYLEVLLMDCTYKTNHFNILLLNIIGTTALGTSFFVGFVFMSSETNEDYLWAIGELKILMYGEDICNSAVVVTD